MGWLIPPDTVAGRDKPSCLVNRIHILDGTVKDSLLQLAIYGLRLTLSRFGIRVD